MGISFIAAFLGVLLFIPTSLFSQHVHTFHDNNGENTPWNETKENIGSKKKNSGQNDQVTKRSHPLQVAAGSRLPDCSHACGSCTPCQLVMVRFLCASLTTQSETCPISYRCMCNGKYYPVP